MTHVPVQLVLAGEAVGVARLKLPWGAFGDPARLRKPAVIAAVDATPKGGKRLRKGAAVRADVLVLDVSPADLVVRRRVVEAALGPALALGELDLVPVALADDEGPLAGDFVLLDPRLRLPMDRDASDADYVDAANPHGSIVGAVRRLAWSAERAPRAAVFRLGEHPEVVLVREDLAAALARESGGGFTVVAPPYPGRASRFAGFGTSRATPLPFNGFVRYGLVVPPPTLPAADVAARAAAAYFRLYAGMGEAGDRALALASPATAYWLARAVDCAPRDDTRAAALAHPYYAFVYANEVDRASRDDTRAAASDHPASAIAYARYVDLGPHDETRRGAQHPALAGSYDEACTEAALARAWVEAEPEVAAGATATEPVKAAKLPWPAHARPRYVDEPGPAEAPTHAPLDEAIRSDIDAFIRHGLALVGLDEAAPPEDVVDAMGELVDDVQKHGRALGDEPDPVMALGCAFGEQLHRALGWQWAMVRDEDGAGGVALVAPDRSIALYPFSMVERLLAPGADDNTVLLTFGMVVSGAPLPGAKPGAYAALV